MKNRQEIPDLFVMVITSEAQIQLDKSLTLHW